MVIKGAINGYGTIGKRVADAVDAQDDMEIIGVTKLSYDYICASGLDFEVMKLLVLKYNFDDFFTAKIYFNLISTTCSVDVNAILITFSHKSSC